MPSLNTARRQEMAEEKEKEVEKEPIGGTRRLEEDDYHEDFQMKNGGFIPRDGDGAMWFGQETKGG